MSDYFHQICTFNRPNICPHLNSKSYIYISILITLLLTSRRWISESDKSKNIKINKKSCLTSSVNVQGGSHQQQQLFLSDQWTVGDHFPALLLSSVVKRYPVVVFQQDPVVFQQIKTPRVRFPQVAMQKVFNSCPSPSAKWEIRRSAALIYPRLGHRSVSMTPTDARACMRVIEQERKRDFFFFWSNIFYRYLYIVICLMNCIYVYICFCFYLVLFFFLLLNWRFGNIVHLTVMPIKHIELKKKKIERDK